MASGGNSFYYHYDPVRSVTNVTSSSGASRWTYAYEPFGATQAETQDDVAAPTNFMKFAGEMAESSALYHLRVRQYDPTSGRFLQMDPVVPDQDLPYIASYAYSADRPTVLVDPTGMFGIAPTVGQDSADDAASPEEIDDERTLASSSGYSRCIPSTGITEKQLRNARIVYRLGVMRAFSTLERASWSPQPAQSRT